MNVRPLMLFVAVAASALTSCETIDSQQSKVARLEMVAAIANEPLGDYYIGRRYYKVDYKFWGFVRRPRQPWSSARMVMLNEQAKFAPDREAGKIGSDNNYEYKLTGEISDEPVYEPASNTVYPEFKLRGAELISTTPAMIYRSSGALDPQRRVIATPF